MKVTSTPQKYFGITGLPSIVDAGLRAAGRYVEVSYLKESLIEGIPSPAVRLPFRYLSEVVRYGLSRMVKNLKGKKKKAKEIWIEGLKKSIEITFGSAFIEPNLYDERLQRVGAGFLNTVARLVGRGGMVLSKFADKENLNLKNLLDEFIARTSARLIYTDTDKAPIKLGLLTLEQLFINQWLAMMPVKEYVLPWVMKKEKELKSQSKKATI